MPGGTCLSGGLYSVVATVTEWTRTMLAVPGFGNQLSEQILSRESQDILYPGQPPAGQASASCG
jgi:hypothetical protein